MNILVDARTVRPGRTGVGYYTEAMVRALAARASDDHLSALVLAKHADELSDSSIALVPTASDYESHPAGDFFEHFALPRLIRRHSIDVFWGPAFLIPWTRTNALKVATIHDLTAFTHPECYPRRFAAYVRLMIRMAARRANALVCVSESVAKELQSRFEIRAPVEVIHNAADEFFSPSESAHDTIAASASKPYLLAVGAGDPRKNTGYLIETYEKLPADLRERYDLLLVGNFTAPVPNRVRVLPRQDRNALRGLYRGATLFLNAAVAEGFGIPPLEAMRCGCPVAVSAAAALPDVIGDAALIFEDRDSRAAAATVAELLRSTDALQKLAHRGLAHAGTFLWNRSAEKLLALFHSLSESRTHRL